MYFVFYFVYDIDSYGWKDWEKKKNIIREMKFCVDFMIEIFGEMNYEEFLLYR